VSQLSVNTITNAAGGNTAQINGMTPTADSLQGFRNRIINGDMRIDQRNLGTQTVNASGLYTVDRWQANQTAAGKFSVGKSTVAPTGFTNSYLATSLSAYSVGSSDIFFFNQNIEGNNISDLAWGTANAKAVTLSFWVRSSLTGDFGGALANSAHDRSYPFLFAVSSADTWEYKTITVLGDTSGTWLTDNGIGIQLIFGLGGGAGRSGTAGAWAASTLYTAAGAVSVVGTSGATFYITGVQLEKGSVATEFERRPYGTELQLCQRYFEAVSGPVYLTYVNVASSNTRSSSFFFRTTKRATPTVVFGGTSEYIRNGEGGVDTTLSASSVTTDSFYVIGPNVSFGIFAVSYTGANNYITMNAEL
jgi:hypothetical protein